MLAVLSRKRASGWAPTLFEMCLSEVPRPGMKEQSILIGVDSISMGSMVSYGEHLIVSKTIRPLPKLPTLLVMLPILKFAWFA